jgi:hypothetical protein
MHQALDLTIDNSDASSGNSIAFMQAAWNDARDPLTLAQSQYAKYAGPPETFESFRKTIWFC